MLQSKNDVLSLLSTIDQTENQIVTIAMMRDRELIIQGLKILGLHLARPNFYPDDQVDYNIIEIQCNFEPERIYYYINQDPYNIAKTIVVALSGLDSIPLYSNLNRKLIEKINS